MKKILFICHGNICRSPMAEFVLKDMVEKLNIKDDFLIESAATSSEEIWGGQGNPIYPPAKEMLRKQGIGNTPYTNYSGKRARQITKSDYDRYDYLLCADSANIRNVTRITGADVEGKIKLMLDIPTMTGRSIADPWYTGDFVSTYEDVRYACVNLLKYLGYETDGLDSR
ncbi:MAG: low molecular weight phosphotyrosine protein phosphatase [Lachnospiraceae bacterium]|nr:low molecular weight phosphotyrosine protein phosphatase [Lachnospiraceae bacterium]